MNKKFTTVIPYFCGLSEFSPDHTRQAMHLREEWFRSCIHSLRPYTNQFFIGCCNKADEEALRPYLLYGNIQVVSFNRPDLFPGNLNPIDNPEYLPIFLLFQVQQFIKDKVDKYPYVYFTEMDQPFYCKDVNNLFDTIDKNPNAYIVPQRFEQIPSNKLDARKKMFPDVPDERFVKFRGHFSENDNYYIVANEPVDVSNYDEFFYVNKKPTTWNAKNPLDEVLSDGSYEPGVDLVSVDYLDDDSFGGAYGAAYLLGNELFCDTQFETIDFQPTEQAGGHCVFRNRNSIALKSRDMFYFHVDHLSGYEYNKNLPRNPKEANTDFGKWLTMGEKEKDTKINEQFKKSSPPIKPLDSGVLDKTKNMNASFGQWLSNK